MIPPEADLDNARDIKPGDWVEARPFEGRGYVVAVEVIETADRVVVDYLDFDTGNPGRARHYLDSSVHLRRFSPRCAECDKPTMVKDGRGRCPWCAAGKPRPTAPPSRVRPTSCTT